MGKKRDEVIRLAFYLPFETGEEMVRIRRSRRVLRPVSGEFLL